jgi:hypothetical protein
MFKIEKKFVIPLEEFTIKLCCLLGCDAVFSGRYLKKIWSKVFPACSLSYPETGCNTLPPKRW